MKRFAIFILMVFAAATFYISCGESNKPENKLKKLKKAVERTAEDTSDKAKKMKKKVDKAAKDVEKVVEKTEDKIQEVAER